MSTRGSHQDSPREGDGFEPSVPVAREPVNIAAMNWGIDGAAKKILRGTDGSNPSPSSRKSHANLDWRRPGRPGRGFLGLLTEAFAIADEIDEGLKVLSEGLATAASGEKMNDAELHRLRGDLLRRLPSPDWTKVETSFRTALAIAREQGSRGYELRAAVSLARLLAQQGRHTEARGLLAPLYGWFTEGFDTPDLKEAKALLEELG